MYPGLIEEESLAREAGEVRYFSGPVVTQMLPMMWKVLQFFGGSPASR